MENDDNPNLELKLFQPKQQVKEINIGKLWILENPNNSLSTTGQLYLSKQGLNNITTKPL